MGKQYNEEELESMRLDALDIEEEEEEEEGEFDPDEEDRGDDVDPDLPDDEAEEVDAEADDKGDDDLDADALAELAGDGKSRSVPHARFNEVNEQWKIERAERLRLEEEMARLRGEKPAAKAADPEPEAAPEFDFKTKRKELREAMYEGDHDAAEKLEDEIEAARMEQMERLADSKAEAKLKAKTEQEESLRQEERLKQQEVSVAQASSEAIAKYPFMDDKGKDYNEEAVEEVLALRNYYIRDKNMSAAEAITLAANKVGQRYVGEDGDTDNKEPAKPSKAQLERNIERSERIPARGAGLGERANKIDYESLTEDQFENLPDAEKKKARGDFVA